MKTQEIMLNAERNVKFTAIIQDVSGEFGKIEARPAVLILPGGGYAMCSDREAEVVAYPYLKAGYQAFVLRYSVGEHRAWPNPLEDYEQAMELILDKREEWHVLENKIAVIGFSAGGHLAACAAAIGKHRPNAAILGYAACNQETADMCQPGMPAPTEYIDEKMCPCFLFAARDDNTVAIENTLEFQQALAAKGISFESHIYAYGQHGFGTGELSMNSVRLCSRVPHWVQDSIDWLGDVLGVLTPQGMEEPVCAGKVNGNSEPVLSVDCTINYLKGQEGAIGVLSDAFVKVDAVMDGFLKKGVAGITAILKILKLKDFLIMQGMPETEIDALNKRLKKIPNQR